MTDDIREAVRLRYAQAATRSAQGDHAAARAAEADACGTCGPSTANGDGDVVFGAELYDATAAGRCPWGRPRRIARLRGPHRRG